MSRSIFLGLIILVLFLIDLYCFQSIKTVFNTNKARLLASVLFYFTTILMLIIMYLSYQQRVLGLNYPFSKYASAILMGIIIGKIILVLLLAIEDFTRLLKWGWNQNQNLNQPIELNRSQFLNSIFLIISSLPLAAFLYGTLKTAYNYQIRKIKVKIPDLPTNWKGVKIVQISDVHSGSFSDREAVIKGIELINSLNPDIFFFTGDLVNNKAIEFEKWVDVFSKIEAKVGKFAILGNHDYGDYVEWPSKEAKVENLNHLKSMMKQCGWDVLLNSHRILDRDGEKLAIVGVENWGAKMHFRRYGNLKKALNGIEDNINCILLSHDPSYWEAEVLNYPQIKLTLSGHTHGMQFGVETKWFRFSPIQWVYKQWAGLYKIGAQQLYVNRGFGFLGYQGRVGIRPEITEITLI